MNHYYVSEERLEELKKELANLKSKVREEVAEELKRAKEFGDLSENFEYTEAKERQAMVETRIVELEDSLKRAVIIKKGEGDTVSVGSTVTAQKGSTTVTYTIVGSSEARPEENKISNESPLGSAFLGKRAGDEAEVVTPAGTNIYKITKIA